MIIIKREILMTPTTAIYFQSTVSYNIKFEGIPLDKVISLVILNQCK